MKIFIFLLLTFSTVKAEMDHFSYYLGEGEVDQACSALEREWQKGSFRESKGYFLSRNYQVFQKGRELFKVGDYSNALICFEFSIQFQKKYELEDSASVYNSGLCYSELNERAKSDLNFRRCLTLGYNREEAWSGLAKNAIKNSDFESALKICKDALYSFPESKQFWLWKFEALVALEKEKEVRLIIDTVILKDRQNKFLYFYRGKLNQHNIQLRQKAISDLNYAIELDSNYFDAIYELGILHYNLGLADWKDAQEIFVGAKKKQKKKSSEYHFSTSVKLLKKAYQLNRVFPGLRKQLIQVYTQLKLEEELKNIK